MLEQINRFLAEQGRRWSPNTVDRYRWYLLDLAKWLEGAGIEEPERADLVRWLDARMRWGSSSQYTATVAARGFYRWLLGREASPAEKVPLPRRFYQPQRVLDSEKVMRILGSLDTSEPKGRRDTAIVLFLLDTGVRSAEACRLQLRHLEVNAGRYSVRVKGGTWESGVFCPYTAIALNNWVADRERIATRDCPEVFCGIGGGKPGTALTPSGLRAIFRQLGAKCGFHFSPHDFRRTAGHMALRRGSPDRVLQEQLHLRSAKQIWTYSRGINSEDFRPYSPVEGMMGEVTSQGHVEA